MDPRAHRNSSGAALVETFEITNMGHAIAIDPQFSFPGSTTACGTTGSYLSDVRPLLFIGEGAGSTLTVVYTP